MKIFISLLVLIVETIAFNFDSKNVIDFRGQRSSMFGFSVTGHRNRENSWVIVGAPEAQTKQPGVIKGGAVYKCSPDHHHSPNKCHEILFDTKGVNNFTGHQIDKKSLQWFGATVNTDGVYSPIIACAPRYLWFTTTLNHRDPIGTCYVADADLTEFNELSPCRTKQWGYHRQGSCQAGFSAAIDKERHRAFIGAPGSWYWQGNFKIIFEFASKATGPILCFVLSPGHLLLETATLNVTNLNLNKKRVGQLYSVDYRIKFPFYPPRNKPFGTGQIFQMPLKTDAATTATYKTGEGAPANDDSYMGYSMALGQFSADGPKGVAVGVPRAANLRGKVSIFSWNLTSVQNITGEQIGSYFGYSIIAVDFDGDRYDDLVIGAPFYTDAAANNAGKYDVGRVYVIYQHGGGAGAASGKFKTVQRLDGQKTRARFGLALAKLGDVDLDGYQDFAVGAPYDGPYERGAVYIYHGSKTASATTTAPKPSQIIYAEDTSQSNPPFTFGFSLAGAVDLDSNHYPDLIVGAYLADTVIVIKARPVIRIESTIQFLTANKLIDFDARNCLLPKRFSTGADNEYAACVPLQVCFSYNGTGVRDRLRFRTRIVLDTKKSRDPRLYFVRGDDGDGGGNDGNGGEEFEKSSSLNITESIEKLARKCYDLTAYLRNDEIRDKLTAIDAEVHFELDPNQFAGSSRELRPILDHDSRSQLQKDFISLRKNCGPDNVCVPDLQLDVKFESNSYIIGSEKPLTFDIRVTNDGEDSFETTFAMRLPPGINYVNTKNNATTIPIQCSITTNTAAPLPAINESFLKCDIGNPLPRNQQVQFKLVLEPTTGGASSDFVFEMMVNSTNPEAIITTGNNRRQFNVNVTVVNELIVEGSTQPKELYYNSTLYSLFAGANTTNRRSYHETVLGIPEAEFGPELTYLYNVRNRGPSAIDETDVYIVWPALTSDGLDLLYVLEEIETSGPIKCQSIRDLNYRGLLLDRKKQATSTLETHGLFDSHRNGSSATDVLLEHDNSWLFTKHDWSQQTFFHSNDDGDDEDVENEDVDDEDEPEWNINDHLDHSRRTKREQKQKQQQQQQQQQQKLSDLFKCQVMNCTVFQCRTGRLDRDREAWIAIRSRISANTLNKIINKQNRELILSSMIFARIVSSASSSSSSSSSEQQEFVKREISTKIIQSDFEPIPKMIPFWLIILAIIAGILVLLLLAFCLKKCGFFNRKRPDNASIAEREPLRYQNTSSRGVDN